MSNEDAGDGRTADFGKRNVLFQLTKFTINIADTSSWKVVAKYAYKTDLWLYLKWNSHHDLYVTHDALLLLTVCGSGRCCRSSQVFRPYAKHLLGPLLQVVVSGNNGGDGIHFMVVDVVVTALSWTSLASPKVPDA